MQQPQFMVKYQDKLKFKLEHKKFTLKTKFSLKLKFESTDRHNILKITSYTRFHFQ